MQAVKQVQEVLYKHPLKEQYFDALMKGEYLAPVVQCNKLCKHTVVDLFAIYSKQPNKNKFIKINTTELWIDYLFSSQDAHYEKTHSQFPINGK